MSFLRLDIDEEPLAIMFACQVLPFRPSPANLERESVQQDAGRVLRFSLQKTHFTRPPLTRPLVPTSRELWKLKKSIARALYVCMHACTQVRDHLLEKARKDREGGVNDTPVEDLEAGGADEVMGGTQSARRPPASVEEAATV